ncbi:MAG: response regulator [Polaromonas sp.]|nr:response regulator [Polaromonas sp.]
MSVKAYVVEDNLLIRDNLKESLKELLNVEVIGHASTEQAACRWLTTHSRDWQLLIVDLFLLEGTGLGVIKQCLRHSTQQRVVVLSNYATEDIRSRCLACGADAVFDKSTELEQFFSYCAVKQ